MPLLYCAIVTPCGTRVIVHLSTSHCDAYCPGSSLVIYPTFQVCDLSRLEVHISVANGLTWDVVFGRCPAAHALSRGLGAGAASCVLYNSGAFPSFLCSDVDLTHCLGPASCVRGPYCARYAKSSAGPSMRRTSAQQVDRKPRIRPLQYVGIPRHHTSITQPSLLSLPLSPCDRAATCDAQTPRH